MQFSFKQYFNAESNKWKYNYTEVCSFLIKKSVAQTYFFWRGLGASGLRIIVVDI